MTQVFVIDIHADEYADALKQQHSGLDVLAARNLSEAPADLSCAAVLIAFGTSVNNELLDRMTGLKWIQSLATGVDHFLRWPGLKADTVITSGRGIHGPSMRETVAYLMLAASRDAVGEVERKQNHVWERRLWKLLAGKTSVVVGSGIAGSAIGKLLQAFGQHVIGVTRAPRAVEGFDETLATSDLPQAAARADFLVNVLPAAKDNLGLIDAKVFTAMKPSAYFINVGRGETVDEPALISVLRDGRIAGAGLDVYAREPLATDNPLWDLKNVFLTPHIGGYFREYEDMVMPIVLDNMAAWLGGRPQDLRNLVKRV